MSLRCPADGAAGVAAAAGVACAACDAVEVLVTLIPKDAASCVPNGATVGTGDGVGSTSFGASRTPSLPDRPVPSSRWVLKTKRNQRLVRPP